MTKARNEGRSIEVEAKALRAALKDVSGVVEARNTIPILSNLLLVATPTALTLTGSDLDIWGERHLTLANGQPLSTTVEVAVLERIVGKLPAEAIVKLTLADGKLTLAAGRSRFSLPTLPIEDFPAAPRLDWDAEFEIQALTLANAFHQVAFAVSTEEACYYLNGVFLHAPESGDLRFASTDGHRLARLAIERPEGAASLPDIIVPRKVVKIVAGLLDRHEGLVDVRVSRGRIRFEIGETAVQAKLIDGTFPDYTRVVPSTSDTVLKIDRAALTEAVGRVATVMTDKVRVVKIVLDRDTATLSASSPENGTALEEVPCDLSGPGLTIGFNSRYLGELLSHLSSDTIEATFTDGAAPTLWRDREDSPLVYVLMPMRV